MDFEPRQDPSSREVCAIVAARLQTNAGKLKEQFETTENNGCRCCWLDDVLPTEFVSAALLALPPISTMTRRASRMERKYVSADPSAMQAPLANLIMGFAQQPVADAVASIMGRDELEVDTLLYNGGITVMVPGDFMRPHLDNSHDYTRSRRREVVVLYYLSPDLHEQDGGALQLWDMPLNAPSRTIAFRSNRLVIMETNEHAWHSISNITGSTPRISVTTYFYAPPSEQAPLRLTRFKSLPGQITEQVLFNCVFYVRNLAARIIGRQVVGNSHVFKPKS